MPSLLLGALEGVRHVTVRFRLRARFVLLPVTGSALKKYMRDQLQKTDSVLTCRPRLELDRPCGFRSPSH
ncbi:hypothetical protein CLOM_g4300 [Closterium sp. NIES-68]|nr:hypothetical protein CLOM_g4300 [Closterium sp. NIES-68]GJP60094.1 hypothetical protein CLOP_g17232 [Closterium sp. NIES-67]